MKNDKASGDFTRTEVFGGKASICGREGKKCLRQTSRGPTVRLSRKPRRSGSVTNGIMIVKKLEGQ